MVTKFERFTVLIAEDDDDDYLLTVQALKAANFDSELHLSARGQFLYTQAGDLSGTGRSVSDPALLLVRDGETAVAVLRLRRAERQLFRRR